jgi:putative PIN family toxin of toxin-antitoxin system
MHVVLDTNIALDLLVFDDPACVPLAAALARGELRWLATPTMREEFARVLGYRLIVTRLARGERTAQAVLAAFDALAHRVPPPAPAPCRCGDPDDQMFIDLAVAHRALLLSKDRAVLSMNEVLAAFAVSAQTAINPAADAGPSAGLAQ